MLNLLKAYILIYTLSLPILAFSQGYVSLGFGNGGNSEAPNISSDLGGVVKIVGFKSRILALGISGMFNGGDVPEGTLEYPCPHSDYIDLGKIQKGDELALFGKYGLEILKEKGFYAFALGGFSFTENIDLAQSTATVWYYEQSSSLEYFGMIGGGVTYFPSDSKICISIDYDNRRGITGSLGLRSM